uniref:Uncharacterized protein n=1 Tax=Zea mays TaxID=4577 RepID=A0A804RQW6_MAIZE
METMQPPSCAAVLWWRRIPPVPGEGIQQTSHPDADSCVEESCSCSDDSNSNEGIHAWTVLFQRGDPTPTQRQAASCPVRNSKPGQIRACAARRGCFVHSGHRSPVPCMLQFCSCFF